MSSTTSIAAYLALIAIVAVQRLAELRLSNRNARAAEAAGAVEMGAAHYPWMVALHSLFLASCPLEVWLLERPLSPALATVMLAVLTAATVLRYTAITALGERWTTRVYHWPGRARITTGPYRVLRHPNYLAVRLEIMALPLIHGAWLTAAVFSILNAWMLHVRTSVEERALAVPTGAAHT